MANSDAPSRPAEPGGASNLPVPVSGADADSDGFFARLARALSRIMICSSAWAESAGGWNGAPSP